MGGGGDVVGALALTEPLEEMGVEWVLGGVAWERSPIDPKPGPRSLEELRGGEPCGPAAVLASGETVTEDGVALSESRMAEHLGQPVLLLDITRGARATAEGIAAAAGELGCDRVVMLDVGGDVLAHGDEPGLASPLCDAIMLAAALELGDAIAAVYGPGCDGELTALEVLQRAGEIGGVRGAAGSLAPDAVGMRAGRGRGEGRSHRGEPAGGAVRTRRAGHGADSQRQANRGADSVRGDHLLLRPHARG